MKKNGQKCEGNDFFSPKIRQLFTKYFTIIEKNTYFHGLEKQPTEIVHLPIDACIWCVNVQCIQFNSNQHHRHHQSNRHRIEIIFDPLTMGTKTINENKRQHTFFLQNPLFIIVVAIFLECIKCYFYIKRKISMRKYFADQIPSIKCSQLFYIIIFFSTFKYQFIYASLSSTISLHIVCLLLFFLCSFQFWF